MYPILTLSRWKREFCRGGCTTSRLSGRETSAFDTNDTNRTRGGQKTRTPYRTDADTNGYYPSERTPFSPSSSPKANRSCLSLSGAVQELAAVKITLCSSFSVRAVRLNALLPTSTWHARTQPALIGCGFPPYHANHHDDTVQQFRRHRSPIFLILTIQI